jgi:hypothetical protein
MSREEDLIRSTTRAIASTVTKVPPLQLEPAPDELGSLARAPRRRRGVSRRWWSWGAPLAAAAMVVALAISLVIVKSLPNGHAVPKNPATTTPSGLDAVPRYYVALKQLGGDIISNNQRNDIVVGDTLTGKMLATFAPPARTVFESVTAAADDRTFVVFGVTSSTGSFGVSAKPKAVTLTGSWFEVRLAPGTAHPARLTHLPIKPLIVHSSYANEGVDELMGSFGSVLSASGTQLAVPVSTVPHRLAVQVFSVTTGQLLHDWTTADTSVVESSSLAWIDGDRKLAMLSRNTIYPGKIPGYVTTYNTVREWTVDGPASGDLLADSKVVWSLQYNKGPTSAVEQCLEPAVGGTVLFSADGKRFSCSTAGGTGPNDHLAFHTYLLAASTTATTQGTTDYDVNYTDEGRYYDELLWASPSGGTLIGGLIPIDGNYPGNSVAVAKGNRIGVISHGTFTPIPFPKDLTFVSIAW